MFRAIAAPSFPAVVLLGWEKLNFGNASPTIETQLQPFASGFIRGQEMSFSSVSVWLGGFCPRFFVILETRGALEAPIAVGAAFQSAFMACPWRSAELTYHFADMLVLLIIPCNGMPFFYRIPTKILNVPCIHKSQK